MGFFWPAAARSTVLRRQAQAAPAVDLVWSAFQAQHLAVPDDVVTFGAVTIPNPGAGSFTLIAVLWAQFAEAGSIVDALTFGPDALAQRIGQVWEEGGGRPDIAVWSLASPATGSARTPSLQATGNLLSAAVWFGLFKDVAADPVRPEFAVQTSASTPAIGAALEMVPRGYAVMAAGLGEAGGNPGAFAWFGSTEGADGATGASGSGEMSLLLATRPIGARSLEEPVVAFAKAAGATALLFQVAPRTYAPPAEEPDAPEVTGQPQIVAHRVIKARDATRPQAIEFEVAALPGGYTDPLLVFIGSVMLETAGAPIVVTWGAATMQVPIVQNTALDFNYAGTPIVAYLRSPTLTAGTKLRIEKGWTGGIWSICGMLYLIDQYNGDAPFSNFAQAAFSDNGGKTIEIGTGATPDNSLYLFHGAYQGTDGGTATVVPATGSVTILANDVTSDFGSVSTDQRFVAGYKDVAEDSLNEAISISWPSAPEGDGRCAIGAMVRPGDNGVAAPADTILGMPVLSTVSFRGEAAGSPSAATVARILTKFKGSGPGPFEMNGWQARDQANLAIAPAPDPAGTMSLRIRHPERTDSYTQGGGCGMLSARVAGDDTWPVQQASAGYKRLVSEWQLWIPSSWTNVHSSGAIAPVKMPGGIWGGDLSQGGSPSAGGQNIGNTVSIRPQSGSGTGGYRQRLYIYPPDDPRVELNGSGSPLSRIQPTYLTSAAGALLRDAWNLIRMQVIANDPNRANGLFQLWANGVLIAQRGIVVVSGVDKDYGIIWRKNGLTRFMGDFINSFFGGTPATNPEQGSPQTQDLWVNDFRLAGTNSVADADRRINTAVGGLPAPGYSQITAGLVGGGWSWTKSGSGTNEYFARHNGGNPYLPPPTQVLINGAAVSAGTLGALAANRHAYGDNDGLGYPTLYVRLSDGADPDTKGVGYIRHTG